MTIEEVLQTPRVKWLQENGSETDVVLSSRVRLARNLQKISFPNRITPEEKLSVLRLVEESRSRLDELGAEKYSFFKMDDLLEVHRWMLMEKHLISPQLAKGETGQGILLREDTAVSIMINEEDHLRIQGMARGLDFVQAFQMANQVDDVLEENHTWAFRSEWGYLTVCPTNVGSGMRASAMLHLPALAIKKQINQLVGAIQPHGMVLRGLDGEGSEANGHIYQLSNQVTLGYSEAVILEKLNQVTKQIIELERKMRVELDINQLADQAGRAYGILKYAHQISSEEALRLASWIRLGRFRNTLPTGKEGWFEELLVAIRPYFLQQLQGGKLLSPNERDQVRAKWLRDKIDG
jgi:Arginine kinase